MAVPYGPTVGPAHTGTLEVYLNQWVKVASGGRVYLSSGVNFGVGVSNPGYLVFKCHDCTDNWHVGLENFVGTDAVGSTSDVIPSVLSDWVKKHRHVCKIFKNPPATATGVCQVCHWPYGAHEESWMGQYKPLPTQVGGLGGQTGYHTVGNMHVDPKNFPPPADDSMKLKQYAGRKFRDVEEPKCE